MSTWIRFDTDTGITVPANVREAILTAAHPRNAHDMAGDEQMWLDALPQDAVEDEAIQVSPYGGTTIRSFSGEVSDRELTTVRELLKYGRRGELAVILEEDDGVRGSIQLYVCNGDGTVDVHDGHTTFPTFGGDEPLPSNAEVISMAEATNQWGTTRASAPATPPPPPARRAGRTLPPPTRGALSIMEEEARRTRSETAGRRDRADRHEQVSETHPSSPTTRL